MCWIGAAFKLYTWLARAMRPLPVWQIKIGNVDLGELVDSAVSGVLPLNDKALCVTIPGGYNMIIPERYACYRSYLTGVYEPQTTKLLLKVITKGMTVVDVGAHIGYFTLLASALVGEHGMVYAFEPDPIWRGVLETNISLNRIRNVMVVPKAASNIEDSVLLFSDRRGGASSLHHRKLGAVGVRVRSTTLDSILSSQNRSVDVIKIDAEGSEVAVLQGMPEISARNPNLRLIIEFYPRLLIESGANPSLFFETLQFLGFKRYYVIRDKVTLVDLPRDLQNFVRSVGRGWVNLLCEKQPSNRSA